MTTKRKIPNPIFPNAGAGRDDVDQLDEKTLDEVVRRVTAKHVEDPPTLDPDHPFFTHEPANSTGDAESAAKTDEYLYE